MKQGLLLLTRIYTTLQTLKCTVSKSVRSPTHIWQVRNLVEEAKHQAESICCHRNPCLLSSMATAIGAFVVALTVALK